MRVHLWAAGVGLSLAFLALFAAPARADVASDRAAAILVFPKVVVDQIDFIAEENGNTDDFNIRRDTIFQITNTSDRTAELQCFYVDATSRCAVTGTVCEVERGLQCPLPGELCLPNWTETDFRIFITPHQPLAWNAATGMAREDVPLDGVAFRGINGASNAGTAIPPLALGAVGQPLSVDLNYWNVFKGELKCVVVEPDGSGSARNVMIGLATLQTTVSFVRIGSQPLTAGEGGAAQLLQGQQVHASQYSAVGIQAIEGDSDGNRVLELGGERFEYNPCPNVLILDHFFDFATNPVVPGLAGVDIPFHRTDLTLVPCTEDIRAQLPLPVTVQYLVFNEFEQRFSTSSPMNCFFQKTMSLIDTPDPKRSIFSAFVAGTLTGQTRIRGVGGGLIGVAERYDADVRLSDDYYIPILNAAVNLHRQGDRTSVDRITLP